MKNLKSIFVAALITAFGVTDARAECTIVDQFGACIAEGAASLLSLRSQNIHVLSCVGSLVNPIRCVVVNSDGSLGFHTADGPIIGCVACGGLTTAIGSSGPMVTADDYQRAQAQVFGLVRQAKNPGEIIALNEAYVMLGCKAFKLASNGTFDGKC